MDSPSLEERAANIRKKLDVGLVDFKHHCPAGSNDNFDYTEITGLLSKYLGETKHPIPSRYVQGLVARREKRLPTTITDVATDQPLTRFSLLSLANVELAQAYVVDLTLSVPLVVDLVADASYDRTPISRTAAADASSFFAWFLLDGEDAKLRALDIPASDIMPSLITMIFWIYKISERAEKFIAQYKAFRKAHLPADTSSPADVGRFLFGFDELLEALVLGRDVPEMASLKRIWKERITSDDYDPQSEVVRVMTRIYGLTKASAHFRNGIDAISADLESNP